MTFDFEKYCDLEIRVRGLYVGPGTEKSNNIVVIRVCSMHPSFQI